LITLDIYLQASQIVSKVKVTIEKDLVNKAGVDEKLKNTFTNMFAEIGGQEILSDLTKSIYATAFEVRILEWKHIVCKLEQIGV